jgi:flagellar hook-associated protein 1 FlgK
VEITNGKDLTASNYEIYYNGNQYTLTRLSDNQVVGTSLDGNFAEVDGLTFTASGVGVAGDKFLIRPVEYGARDISVLVSDPKSIAAAGPLRANTPGENQGSVEITISDIGDPDNLTFNDYQIQFVDDGAGGLAYFVSNEGNQVFPSPPLLVAGASTNTGDGVITLTDEGDQSNADYFTSLTIVFEDPVDPADPLIYRVLDATTGLELGSGDYVDGNDLFPTANGAFEPGYQLVIADGATPFVAGDSFSVERNLQPYTSGDEIAIPNDGFSITMTGVPAIGDTFSIERNSGGVGDNQNALRLLALETTRMVDGSQTTLQESYSGMVSNVGTITQRIDVNLGAQYALLQNSIQNREMVSGVNLDEEAANLLRFQQAYQASAQMIKIASSLFDSILSVVG